MNRMILKSSHILAILVAGLFLSEPAFAEKPAGVGHDENGKNARNEKHERYDDRRDDRNDRQRHDYKSRGGDVNVSVYFGDQHRAVIHDYYQEHYQVGHCPPGLAKKHNGCMPPGQAKRWRKGYPLPRDVIFYDLPPSVVVQLGPPPPRHRYVRVAADILLIAIGTGMVVDAIEDMGNM